MKRRGKIALLLGCLAICTSAALLSLHFRTPAEPLPAELYAVIYRQVQALQRQDFPAAYAQAAPETQQKFSVEQFAELVRTQYPILIQARRVEFGRVQRRGPDAYIQVFFFTPESVQPCIYQLNSESGAWKIRGARLLRRVPESPRVRGIEA